MAGMGPPPKHPDQRRRRNKNAPDLTLLPSDGRKGETPLWPLPKPRAEEKRLWAQLWQSPQSSAWERLGWTRAVARYTRTLVDAEQQGAPITLLGEVRQMEDRLGLTPMSMLRLRWKVADDELAEARQDHPAAASARRLRAVDPAAAG